MHELLQCQLNSASLYNFLLLVEAGQFLWFAIHPDYNFLWQTSFSQYPRDIVKYLQVIFFKSSHIHLFPQGGCIISTRRYQFLLHSALYFCLRNVGHDPLSRIHIVQIQLSQQKELHCSLLFASPSQSLRTTSHYNRPSPCLSHIFGGNYLRTR